MLFKLSDLRSNFTLTPGYLNPALNNSALGSIHLKGPVERPFFALTNEPEIHCQCQNSTRTSL